MSISVALLYILFAINKIYGDVQGNLREQQSVKGVLRMDYERYFETGQESELLRSMKHTNDLHLNELALEALTDVSNDIDKTKEPSDLHNMYLMTCGLAVNLVKNYAEDICSVTGTINMLGLIKYVTGYFVSENTCNKIYKKFVDHIRYIQTSKNYTNEFLCDLLLQGHGQKATCNIDWSINIPEDQENARTKQVKYDSENLRVLQFTDLHYDNGYEFGADADCGEPQCCNIRSGYAEDPKDGAGYWADYRFCDLPFYTIEDTFRQIQQRGDYNYVYFTGDVIDHRTEDMSIDISLQNINAIYDLMKNYFKPGEFFPAIGNHESNPINLFTPESVTDTAFSTKWLYNQLSSHWMYWLPFDTMKTIRKGGYYTVLARPGFRIVALNSNVGCTLNFWLAYDCTDTYGQLEWLVAVLLEAERMGERVHILSHLKIGARDTWYKWAHEYRRIVERFKNTIAAEFNGHTHLDEFTLFYSLTNSSKPIHAAYNGGSLTPYFDMNPNYKIYDIHPTYFAVENYETWYFNVTQANLNGPSKSPEWKLLHKFGDTWNISSMGFLSVMDNLIRNRIAKNVRDFKTYYRHVVRNGDPFLRSDNLNCNLNCMMNVLCQLIKTDFIDDSNCVDLINNSFLSTYSLMELYFFRKGDPFRKKSTSMKKSPFVNNCEL